MAKYDIILFDLDGTVSESGLGVKRCIEEALAEMHEPQADLSDYSNFIGPPLLNTFSRLCGLGDEKAHKAIKIYNKHYNTIGIENNRVYDGMKDVLQILKDNEDVKVGICSSKDEKLAMRVLEFLGVEDMFDAVCGSLQNGTRKEKKELIPYAVKTLGETMDKRIVLIGDTRFDAEGAKIIGIDFIGVDYGYGIKSEMIELGAKAVVDTPKEILDFVI